MDQLFEKDKLNENINHIHICLNKAALKGIFDCDVSWQIINELTAIKQFVNNKFADKTDKIEYKKEILLTCIQNLNICMNKSTLGGVFDCDTAWQLKNDMLTLHNFIVYSFTA